MSNDHDPFDHDLAAALRRRAGTHVAPVDAAHDAVLRRATGIRRRRAAVAGGGLLAVAVMAIALLPRGDGGSDTVAPADSPDVEISGDDAGSSSTTSTSSPSSSTSVSPTTVDLSVPTVPTVAPVTAPATSAPTASSEPDGEDTTTAPRNSSSTSSTSSSSSTSTSSSTSSPSSTSTTVADQTPTAFTRTYQSGGGSITVSFDGERLSLDAVAAADGHEAEIQDDSADRVRVRFNGPNESRIEIRVENGEIREQIDG